MPLFLATDSKAAMSMLGVAHLRKDLGKASSTS